MIRQYLKNEVYNTCFAQLELEERRGDPVSVSGAGSRAVLQLRNT